MNVRKSPDIDSKTVTSLKKGHAVNIIQIEENGKYTWGKIDTDDSRWVCLKENDQVYMTRQN